MATEIQDGKCNGWAVIPKSILKKDDGRNFHITEVHIAKGAAGNDHLTYGANVTCCGLGIKPSADYGKCFCRKESQDSFRIKLAEWQNDGYELCGRCVGHFYKDPPQS